MKRIANILTLSRLALVPAFLFMLMFDEPLGRWIFLFIFTYASVTDFLDGHIARTYSATSTFGRVFDSLADKLLVLVVSITIMLRDKNISFILLTPVIVILFRELLISGLRESLAEKNLVIKTSKMAKYKTTFQLIALGFLIVGGNETLFYVGVQYTGIVLIYIAMTLSFITGLQYVRNVSDHL